MSFKQNTLSIFAYARTLRHEDGRPLAMVHGLERVFPGLNLAWTVSGEMQLVLQPDRDAWLARARRKGGGFPLVCNNNEDYAVTLSGVESPARLGPGGHALLDVHAQFPLDTAVVAAAADMLEALAEGAQAHWGHATPFNASAEISRQTVHPVYKPQLPPRGLPALKLPEELHSPEIPQCLGWLNYWSAAAALAVGFPDPARDTQLLSRSRRTASGGWIVPLTKVPLDLDLPAHLDELLNAYERFPAIGGRATP